MGAAINDYILIEMVYYRLLKKFIVDFLILWKYRKVYIVVFINIVTGSGKIK